ncbi:hypothetical protein Egran_03564 [Elaphomyces granulatus]|uniref:Uncharacterized protein n=1 Tax=Elaphomyces granulatus TaxID=519963 RepID=A0A232LX02_9EURO|nr:hypothetical protein Egran_03564 [Elaphomyces granulatus]
MRVPCSLLHQHHDLNLVIERFGGSQGVYVTHILASESDMLPMPVTWCFEDAAGLFITIPTAYGALVHRARVQPGEWVLVNAAAGGQLREPLGKRKIAQDFGADYAIGYSDPNWLHAVMTLYIGWATASWVWTLSTTSLLVIGFAAGIIEKVALNRALLLTNASLVGMNWGQYPKTVAAVWRGIFDLTVQGKFREQPSKMRAL